MNHANEEKINMAKKSSGSGRNRHVVRSGKGWAVKKPGTGEPQSRHRTQGAAEREAKRQVRRDGGGEVRVHGRDGRIRDSDTVAPGRDPFPPRDRKHYKEHPSAEFRFLRMSFSESKRGVPVGV